MNIFLIYLHRLESSQRYILSVHWMCVKGAVKQMLFVNTWPAFKLAIRYLRACVRVCVDLLMHIV